MNVELRNVKFASRETNCFSATVVVDGVALGVVSNDGGGGADRYSTWALGETLEAWAKTLPAIDDLSGGTMPQSAETAIGGLLEAFLLRRTLRRDLSSRVVFERDGKLYTVKPPSKAAIPALCQDYARRPDVALGHFRRLVVRR